MIKDIFSAIKKDKTSPEEYARMKDEYSDEEYIHDKKQEARQEAKIETTQDIARTMLKKGLDIDFIAEITGLSAPALQALMDE